MSRAPRLSLENTKEIEILFHFKELPDHCLSSLVYQTSLATFQRQAPLLWKVISRDAGMKAQLSTLNAAICQSEGVEP